MTLDAVQQGLIEALQRNARTTNRRLAELVGLAPSSSLQRVRDLEERGVITGYHAEIDLAALRRNVQAMVFVRLAPADAATVDAFFETVSAFPETIAVSLLSGAEDAVVHVAVGDVQQLRRVVLEKISAMACVSEERTSLVFEHRRSAVIGLLDEHTAD